MKVFNWRTAFRKNAQHLQLTYIRVLLVLSGHNVSKYASPAFAVGEFIDLVLEVNHNLLVLLLEEVSGFFWLQVDIFQKLAEFGQLGITFSVDLELKNADLIQIVFPEYMNWGTYLTFTVAYIWRLKTA